MIDTQERPYLERCLALAEQALDAGDEPFGSVLVDGRGRVRAEDRNRIAEGPGDATRHPEFALARWAAEHMSADERAASTVYTSGEHCPMCAAAHAWVGLGRIVYASSSNQLVAWLDELGAAKPPVTPRPIHEIAPDVLVAGPVPDLAERVQALHARRHAGG
ncbi:nucleoside deaminase [Salinisphaera sp.]|uniref:nucleoside deaminase n=1 Tax=Salinisphaera sp. TaxID=1914330 RepID=UPI000C52F178|nr:nucleoside deaminase [Salinisphaera sp.]MBS63676.1 tRNA-specific adenosine deaminase [Salinisphaera sp.]